MQLYHHHLPDLFILFRWRLWIWGKYLGGLGYRLCRGWLFVFIIWQDSHDKVTLYHDCLVQEKERDSFRKSLTP